MSGRRASTKGTSACAGGWLPHPARSLPPWHSPCDPHGHAFHPPEHHRVDPLRLARELDAPKTPQHLGYRDLALEPGQRESQADMHTEAERQVRHAVALEDHAIRVRIRARIAVRRVQHDEHALARLEGLAVQLVPGLDDAHLRA